MRKRRLAVVTIAFLVAFIDVVTCSHFRGGSMTWRAVEKNNKMKVEISYKVAYQIDTDVEDNDCTQEKVDAQEMVAGDNRTFKVFLLDGTKVDPAKELRSEYRCTERHEAADYPSDKSNSWIIGENKQIVDLPDDLMQFNFLWDGCCWIKALNNYNQWKKKSWDFLMSVNLVPRTDTGEINHPPQTTGIPVKVISMGCDETNITIPTNDADGDAVGCRWVKKKMKECRVNCGGDSSIWTLESTMEGCRLVVTPRNASPGWYAVPIMLEDFSGGTPLNRVPFQFMLKIVDKETCQRPEIVSPPPDSCLVLPVGEEYSLTLTARAVTSDTSIRDIMTSGLIGMRKSAIQPVSGRPQEYYVTLTWTPPESERGSSKTLCFQPEDSDGFQGEMHCINLYVGAINPPVPDPMKSFPSEDLHILYKKTNFYIVFDSLIRRPKTVTEIQFLRASDGSLVYSLPVEPTSADEAVVYYPDSILLAIPPGLFQPDIRYRIELPRGLARGRRLCGVPSEAASWNFFGDQNGFTPGINEKIALSPECYETYMQIFIPQLIVPSEDPTDVYFREPSCVARSYNATHFLMRTDYQFCGTDILPRDGNVTLVTNDIRIAGKTVPESESVTRAGSQLIHVVCRISNDQTTFLALDTDIILDKEVTVEAQASYNHTLVMYEDGSYSRPVGYSTYPLHAPVRERLYFEAAAIGRVSGNRAIHLRSCIATPFPNPHDRLSYQFIENGCPVDETVEFGSVTGSAIRFSIESFAFLHHFLSDSIVFHCDVSTMTSTDIPQCQAKRRRRSADAGNMDGL